MGVCFAAPWPSARYSSVTTYLRGHCLSSRMVELLQPSNASHGILHGSLHALVALKQIRVQPKVNGKLWPDFLATHARQLSAKHAIVVAYTIRQDLVSSE